MIDFVPDDVLVSIQDSYKHGVLVAEQSYDQSNEDEDAVTGALGQALFVPKHTLTINGTTYIWRTDYYKLRGRGKGAEEKIYGADGIFQIQVRTETNSLIASKGLLFQAKNQWEGKDRKLGSQALQLASSPGSGIVIDYSPSGYFACSAEVAHAADGDRRRVQSAEMKSLIEVLAGEFLYCRIGILGMYYDRNTRRITVHPYDAVVRNYSHEITTTVAIQS